MVKKRKGKKGKKKLLRVSEEKEQNWTEDNKKTKDFKIE